MTTPTQFKVISKIMNLSNNYHKLSLLTYQLGQSLEIKCKKKNWTDKEFREYCERNKIGDELKGFEDIL